MPDVSVIIPTLNRPALVDTAIRSALRQQGVSVEVIVIDDGSLLAPSSALMKPDPRLTWHRKSRGGVGAARNAGIARATGTWVAFLDDDDVWAPGKLMTQLRCAVETGRQWAYGGYVDVDANLRLLGGLPPPDPDQLMETLDGHNCMPAGASNVIVRSDALARVGGFDEDLVVHEDWDLWLRLRDQGPPARAGQPLVGLRWHEGNVSYHVAAMLRYLPLIAERHGIQVDYPRHLRWAAWTALSADRRVDAARWYLAAAAHGDLSSLLRAAAACLAPRSVWRSRQAHESLGSWALDAEEWLRELR
jgi:hypothetical protein